MSYDFWMLDRAEKNFGGSILSTTCVCCEEEQCTRLENKRFAHIVSDYQLSQEDELAALMKAGIEVDECDYESLVCEDCEKRTRKALRGAK